jgi:hypothetical protein
MGGSQTFHFRLNSPSGLSSRRAPDSTIRKLIRHCDAVKRKPAAA